MQRLNSVENYPELQFQNCRTHRQKEGIGGKVRVRRMTTEVARIQWLLQTLLLQLKMALMLLLTSTMKQLLWKMMVMMVRHKRNQLKEPLHQPTLLLLLLPTALL